MLKYAVVPHPQALAHPVIVLGDREFHSVAWNFSFLLA
jgi:hypothetical protein